MKGFCITPAKFLSILFALASLSVAGEKTYGTVLVGSVVSVYDGDTFTASFNNKSWPAIIRDSVGVRVFGVDTPEMTDKRDSVKALAKKAKEFTAAKLHGAKRIRLYQMRRDKYFRIVATVLVDGKDLGEMLIWANLAKPYNGGTKTAW